MADVTHREHKHEPTPFEQFERLTRNLLKVPKDETSGTTDREKEDKQDAQKEPRQ